MFAVDVQFVQASRLSEVSQRLIPMSPTLHRYQGTCRCIRTSSELYITQGASPGSHLIQLLPPMLSGSNPHPKSRIRGRSPATKDSLRISPPSPTASSTFTSRSFKMDSCPCCGSVLARPSYLLRGRRRTLFSLFALVLLFLFLFSPSHDFLGLPPALQGLRRVSPASITSLMGHRVNEIHGLLYYTVNENEALAYDALDPSRSLDLSVYANGETAPKPDWPARVKLLNAETPLIVFSKVRLSVFVILDKAEIVLLILILVLTDVLPVGGGILGCFLCLVMLCCLHVF